MVFRTNFLISLLNYCLSYGIDFRTFLMRNHCLFIEKKEYRHNISETQIPGYQRKE